MRASRQPMRRRVTTTDVDEARAEVGQIFCPHRLEPARESTGLSVRLRSASVGSIGLTYLDYGDSVRIEPGPLEKFFLVQIPLAGRATIRCGREEIVSDPTLASVPHPDDYLDMHWAAGNPQLIFYAERGALERQLARLLGRTEPVTPRFALGMRMDDHRAQAWWRSIMLLRDEIVHDSPLLAETASVAQLEQMIMSQLLLAQPHSYSDELQAAPASPPRLVARARALIDDHACEELTVADVAERVGVSVRALQDGFRRHLGTTPTDYLRDVRMRNVRAELEAGDPLSTTVTEAATRCGFTHLGRFSVDYRRRFGESPSQTLAGK